MLILIIIVLLIIAFYFNEYRTWKNGPPGPFPIPILGNIIQIARASEIPHLSISKLAESYGEIFRLKMGFKDIVILASYDSVVDVLTKDEVLGRDPRGSILDRQEGRNTGLAFSEGETWEVTRKWTIRNLRNLGLGKSSAMKNGIDESVTKFIQNLDDSLTSNVDILDVSSAFPIPVTELVWKMLVGHYTSNDESLLARLIHGSEKMARTVTLAGVGLANAFPFVRFIFPKYTFHDIQMNFVKDCRNVAKVILQEEMDSIQKNPEKPTNLTEAYVQKLKSDGHNNIFNSFNYETLFMDMLQAASDTTSSYLEALMLFMVLYPDVQEKVYNEIQERIPAGQPVQIEDLTSMIYTQAVMHEVHRHTKVVQNLLPRKTTENIYYKKYFIPKGTCIMADMYSVYSDEKIFPDSTKFNPNRFISEQGLLVNQQYMIPFSVGKRNCPGQALAETTSFMFFVRILQKFILSIVPGESRPREDMNVTLTSRPFPFNIKYSRR